MKVIRSFAWGAALAAALCVTVVAQQAPAGYHQIYCVKVKPGRDAQFNAMVNGDLRKLVQYDLNSGRLSSWIVLSAMIPAGEEAPCDAAVIYFYPGLPPAPQSDAAMAAELQKAIGKTPQEFDQELEANATLVIDNITRYLSLVGGAKKGDYLVFNSMKVPNLDAWAAWEKTNWQPFAEASVKDGALSGWALNVQIFPHGAKVKDAASTVDIYPTYQAAISGPFGNGGMDRWKKVHPGESVDDAMDQGAKLCTIESSVLYKVEDAVFASK
jgi:hypothetical protein